MKVKNYKLKYANVTKTSRKRTTMRIILQTFLYSVFSENTVITTIKINQNNELTVKYNIFIFPYLIDSYE